MFLLLPLFFLYILLFI